MQATLEGGDWTVLVPSDGAINGLSNADQIRSDPETAREFVLGHLVNGSSDAAALAERGTVNTEGGHTLVIAGNTITSTGGGTASITAPDQEATNGFVHGISGVLFAPEPPQEPPQEPPATEAPTTAAP
jgi:uncharacterized surface protein with fasciclin (FAS1) repeats